jgi:hypothetical protein
LVVISPFFVLLGTVHHHVNVFYFMVPCFLVTPFFVLVSFLRFPNVVPDLVRRDLCHCDYFIYIWLTRNCSFFIAWCVILVSVNLCVTGLGLLLLFTLYTFRLSVTILLCFDWFHQDRPSFHQSAQLGWLFLILPGMATNIFFLLNTCIVLHHVVRLCHVLFSLFVRAIAKDRLVTHLHFQVVFHLSLLSRIFCICTPI